MGRRIVLFISTYLSAIAAPCWAHHAHDPEELGHHWEIAAYHNEIRFQMAAIATVFAAYLIVVRLAKTLRKWFSYKC
ncbi:MAG: hypothetical protein QHI38_02440 [Armatimonadota bacterium]|nr:hypothetical protein [Armatimonadota bacterium]